jgi:hypothetical protein
MEAKNEVVQKRTLVQYQEKKGIYQYHFTGGGLSA